MHPQIDAIVIIFLVVTNVSTLPSYIHNSQTTTAEPANSSTEPQIDDYDLPSDDTNKSLNSADTLKFLEKFVQTYIDEYFEKKLANQNRAKLSAVAKSYVKTPSPFPADAMDDLADYPNDDSGVDTVNNNTTQNQTMDALNMTGLITSGILKQQDDRRHRDREMRKNAIRQQILETVGRIDGSYLNGSKPTISTNKLNVPDLIISQIGNGSTGRKILSNPEKYQSFVPKCEIPKHTDQATWTDSSYMNLFFNINISNHKDGLKVYIAKATLRLYKISPENINQVDGQGNKDAASGGSAQSDLNFVDKEDRQIRVSIYWYTRTRKEGRKHRVKRRLSDSKMISIYDPRHGNAGEFIEFNIRPAARSWLNTGRNLGLGVVVEDQECNILPANKFFKNIDCHNNNQASQIFAYPRPIFEQIFNNRQSLSNIVEKSHNRTHHEPRQQQQQQYQQEQGTPGIVSQHQHQHRSTATRFGSINTENYNSVFFLPTINLCTVDIPAHLDKLKMDEIKRTQCDFDLNNIYVDNITESVQNDSPTDSSPVFTTTHRTRHRHPVVADPRDVDMQNKKVIFTHAELESLLRKNILSATTEQTLNNR